MYLSQVQHLAWAKHSTSTYRRINLTSPFLLLKSPYLRQIKPKFTSGLWLNHVKSLEITIVADSPPAR